MANGARVDPAWAPHKPRHVTRDGLGKSGCVLELRRLPFLQTVFVHPVSWCDLPNINGSYDALDQLTIPIPLHAQLPMTPRQ
jgi:hypothetical protein